MYNSALEYGPNIKPIMLGDLVTGNKKLPAGIFNLVHNPVMDKLEIIPAADRRFKLPDKIYGRLPDYAHHFWDAYTKTKDNLGVLLTGEKGTGKSELSKLICNLAVDNQYPVLNVYSVEEKKIPELIELVESLGDIVIFMDEFGKNFPVYLQDKLLPLLSSSNGGKKLFLITENSYFLLSTFIRSRPGRARYHLDFKRLESEVVEEYMADFPISKQFKEQILRFYEKSNRFTFDYLKTLIAEHITFPNMPFEDLVKLLNIDELKTKFYMLVKNVYLIDKQNNTRTPVKFVQVKIPTASNSKRSRIPINIMKTVKGPDGVERETPEETIFIRNKDVIKIVNENKLFKCMNTITKNVYEVETTEVDEDTKNELVESGVLNSSPGEDDSPFGF